MKLAKVRHRVMAALLDFVIVCAVLAIMTVGKIPFLVSMINNEEHVVTTKFIVDTFRYGIIYSFFLLIYYVIIPLFAASICVVYFLISCILSSRYFFGIFCLQIKVMHKRSRTLS